jgi:cell division protein FtsI (penicillin-binding protein 3)
MTVGREANPLVKSRIAFVAVSCAVAFTLVGARLVDIMVFRAQPAHFAGDTLAPLHPMRADFVDRNDALIARDLPVSDLYAQPVAFWDTDEAAHQLAATLGLDEARLKEEFAPKRGYISIKRGLTPDQKDQVMALGLPGLDFQDSYKRFYPEGRITAQAVGQVDVDDKGVSGLELGLNKQLLADGANHPEQLSFDLRVQYILEHELAESIENFHAKAGGGIVIDVRTGEVLALASLPDFEPNERELGPGDSTRNRMTQDVYELGSIFKIFAFSEAMDEKVVRLDEQFDVAHKFVVGKFAIGDAEKLGPYLSTGMVLAQSSNVGTAQIAARFGAEHQRAFLTRMGLLRAVQSELPESAAPLQPRQWGPTESATVSFGQGISVSPLSFVAAAAAVVNGGTKIVPTFLKTGKAQNGERVMGQDASDTMRQLMRLVVTDGTGKKADVPGYDVGGKTGSAEKPNGHGYDHHKLITSFCGVFPIDAPRYLVFVLLDEPKATKDTYGFATAGWTTAPLVGRIIARIAPLLGVPRKDVFVTADRS